MKNRWLILLLVIFLPMSAAAEDMQVTHFANNSFYVFIMGGQFFDLQSDLYFNSSGFIAPIYGAGYTFVNIKDRFLINLEFDYTPGHYDLENLRNLEIDFYTFWSTVEYKFERDRIALFSSLGLAFIQYGVSFNDVLFALAVNIGMKVRLNRKLLLRIEMRSFIEDSSMYGSDYVYDEFLDSYYYERGSYGSALAIGLEYHF